MTCFEYIQGKNPNELDVVIFCNIGDVVQKELEKYKGSYPKIVKLVEGVRERAQKIVDEYNIKFPKQKADEKKAAPAKAKEEAKKEDSAPPKKEQKKG